jgi:site-specific DNA-methyltransferase (adenine-specific)
MNTDLGGDLRDPKAHKRKLEDPTVSRFENIAAYKKFTRSWLKPCVDFGIKQGGTLVIWTNVLGKAPICSIASELGYHLQGEYIWAKRTSNIVSPTSTKNEVLLRVYESALVFTIDPAAATAKANPADTAIPWAAISGYHDEGSITSHPHPCHKPFSALEPLLRQWTKPGDRVLDCFAGSGGILTALVQIGNGPA